MERGKGVGSTLQVERREVVHYPVCPMCPTGGTQHLPCPRVLFVIITSIWTFFAGLIDTFRLTENLPCMLLYHVL